MGHLSPEKIKTGEKKKKTNPQQFKNACLTPLSTKGSDCCVSYVGTYGIHRRQESLPTVFSQHYIHEDKGIEHKLAELQANYFPSSVQSMSDLSDLTFH